MLLSLLVHLRDALRTMGTHTPDRILCNGMEMRGRVNGQTPCGSTAQPRSGLHLNVLGYVGREVAANVIHVDLLKLHGERLRDALLDLSLANGSTL